MSKPDQTPARAEASSGKTQVGTDKTKGQKGPPLPQSLALPLLLSPLNSTPRQRMVMRVLSNLRVVMKSVKMTRGMNMAVLLKNRTMMAKKKNL